MDCLLCELVFGARRWFRVPFVGLRGSALGCGLLFESIYCDAEMESI